MLLYGLYISPLWKKLDQKSRAIRILLLGTVIYVVLYSILYSKISNILSTLTSYRKYLYFIATTDFILTFSNFYKNYNFIDKKKKKKKKNKKPHYYEYLARYKIPQQQIIQNQQLNSFEEKPIKEEIFVKSFEENKKKLPLIKLDELRQINKNKQELLVENDNKSISSIPVYNTNQEDIPIYKSKFEDNEFSIKDNTAEARSLFSLGLQNKPSGNDSIPVYNQKI